MPRSCCSCTACMGSRATYTVARGHSLAHCPRIREAPQGARLRSRHCGDGYHAVLERHYRHHDGLGRCGPCGFWVIARGPSRRQCRNDRHRMARVVQADGNRALPTCHGRRPWRTPRVHGSARQAGLPPWLHSICLNLISDASGPLRTHPVALELLAMSQNAYLGVTVGVLATALLQSSSVTIGIGILPTPGGPPRCRASRADRRGSQPGNYGDGFPGQHRCRRRGPQNRRGEHSLQLHRRCLVSSASSCLFHGDVWLVGDPQMAVVRPHLAFNLVRGGHGFLVLRRIMAGSTQIVSA